MITEQPKPAKLKIKWEFNPDTHFFITASGRVKRGDYCRACGSPLTDAVSIERGYGRKYWNQLPVKIILEIPAGEEQKNRVTVSTVTAGPA